MDNPQITVTITKPLMDYLSKFPKDEFRNVSDFARHLLCLGVVKRGGMAVDSRVAKRGRPAKKGGGK